MTEIKVIVDDEGHDVDVVFDENIEVAGGGKITKEIVVVDIEKMISEQNVTLFMDLSRRYASGEIVIVGSLFSQTAVVNGVAYWSETRVDWVVTSGQWQTPTMLEGGEFKPRVTVYGIECDSERIVIGSGNIENSDLSDYVKNTDYATADKAGVIKSSKNYGFVVNQNGLVWADTLRSDEYKEKSVSIFISKGTLENIKYAYVKGGLVDNTITLTDEEKANACEWLGAMVIPAKDAGGHWLIPALNHLGVQTTIKLSYSPLQYTLVPYQTGGKIRTNAPSEPSHCTNKDYVDNLPEYLTLTDEQKTKWRGLIGSTKLYKHSIPIPIENGLSFLSPNAELVYYSTSNEPNYTSSTPIKPRLSEVMNGIQPRIIDDGVGVNVVVFGSIGESIFRLNTDGTILKETIISLGDDTVTEL